MVTVLLAIPSSSARDLPWQRLESLPWQRFLLVITYLLSTTKTAREVQAQSNKYHSNIEFICGEADMVEIAPCL